MEESLPTVSLINKSTVIFYKMLIYLDLFWDSFIFMFLSASLFDYK